MVVLAVVIPVICITFFPVIKLLFMHRNSLKISNTALDFPAATRKRLALRDIVYNPFRKFHFKANRIWAMGYCLYHIGVVMLVTGYAVSALIIFIKYMGNVPIPDVTTGYQTANSLTAANILALVFGNGEHIQAQFLFGKFGQLFIAVSWIDIIFAFCGNQLLLYTTFRKKSGAVQGPIDQVVAGIRIKGGASLQHLMVRLTIFFIIISEILARLHLMDGIIYYHALAAMTLILFFCFTYLLHIAYAPLALYMAYQKRRYGVFA